MNRLTELLSLRGGISVRCSALILLAAILSVVGGLFRDQAYWLALGAFACLIAAALLIAQGIRARLVELKQALKKSESDLFINLAVEQHAMHCVMSRFPQCTLPTTGWSMRFSNLHRILDLLDERKPINIVEFGSGLSSVMVASWLQEQGRGLLVSIDHDANWAAKTRAHLERCALSEFATIVDGPLVSTTAFGASCEWYDLRFDTLPASTIDFVIIDGPPAGTANLRRSRLPALERLYSYLSDDAIVVLDDACRKGEREVVREWLSRYRAFESSLFDSPTGLAILRNAEPLHYDAHSGQR